MNTTSAAFTAWFLQGFPLLPNPMEASHAEVASGGSAGGEAYQSPDGFCKGLGHGGLSPAGAA